MKRSIALLALLLWLSTVALVHAQTLPSVKPGQRLGFAVRREAGVANVQGSTGEFNWGGAGGTFFWVDPKEDLFVVYAMQSPKERVYYRPVLKNMIYSAVVKPNGQ